MKMDSAASSGGQGKLTYFVLLSLSPFEVELPILAFFLIYTC
jgi:hypothetical protein